MCLCREYTHKIYRVHSSPKEGVLLFGNARLAGCAITGNARVGVYMVKGVRALLEGNTVDDNRYHGVWIPEAAHGNLVGNILSNNRECGLKLEDGSQAELRKNVFRGNHEYGAYADPSSNLEASALEDNTFTGNGLGDIGGPGWEKVLFEARDEGEWAAVATWWEAQNNKRRRARGGRRGEWVFPPDAFDVTVAPGRDVQAAVKRCPRGGSVLLLPGVHEGPLDLTAGKTVHVFGRGRAVLRADCDDATLCLAGDVTVDGLIIRHAGDEGSAVSITGGSPLLQACDVTCLVPFSAGVEVVDAAPVIAGCR